jgi:hypothetical protein
MPEKEERMEGPLLWLIQRYSKKPRMDKVTSDRQLSVNLNSLLNINDGQKDDRCHRVRCYKCIQNRQYDKHCRWANERLNGHLTENRTLTGISQYVSTSDKKTKCAKRTNWKS